MSTQILDAYGGRIAELERQLAIAEGVQDNLEQINERYRAALEYIAHFDDEAMKVARTLHYDMRAKARAATRGALSE